MRTEEDFRVIWSSLSTSIDPLWNHLTHLPPSSCFKNVFLKVPRERFHSFQNFPESVSEVEGSLERYQIIFYNSRGFLRHTDKNIDWAPTLLGAFLFVKGMLRFFSFCLLSLEQTFIGCLFRAAHTPDSLMNAAAVKPSQSQTRLCGIVRHTFP